MSRFRGNSRFGGPGPGGPPRHLMRGGGPPRGGRGGFQHGGRQPQNLMMGGPGPRGPPRGGFQNNNFRGRGNFRGGNNRGPVNTAPSSSNIKIESQEKNEVQEFPVPPVKEEPKTAEEQPEKSDESKKDKPAETVEVSKLPPESPAAAVQAPEPEVPKADPPAEESVPHLTEVYISEYLCDLYLDVDKDGVTGFPKSTSGFDCLWASLRATHGVSGGKIAFEVLALENTSTSTEHNACVLRVGWSHDEIDISLGENGTSWGYGGTAKKSHDNKYLNYGEKYGAGDAITCYIDLESKAKTISFAINGKHFGPAFTLTPDQMKKPLFPSVSTKNVKFLLNFGQQPTKQPLLDGYKMIAFTSADHIHPCVAGPATLADAEFVMMVGLPAAGKSTWCESHAAAHPDKRYNILGTNLIMEKMKITGLTRKRNYHGRWEELIQKATGILNTLFKIVEQKLERFPRNIILDQTNVYESARRRKLRNFSKFGRKVAVVIVNTGDELNKRNAKREKEEGKFVPESAVMEMKANFRTPALTEGLTEVQFIEMEESGAKKQIDEYQAEGKKYKERGGRRSEGEKPKPGEKRMPEKPPFEDKLNKRAKPDNEPSRSDGGRQPSNSSRDKSSDGDRSRSGPDRPSRSFDDRRRDSDRKDLDRRDDRDRRVERGGSSRGGFSVTVDRKDDNRAGRKSAEKDRSGERASDRGNRGDQGGRFDRRNDRDSRGESNRGRDDRRGGGSRFGNRDTDNKDEGAINRDRGGFRGGNNRGRDFGRGDTRGGRDDRSSFGGNQNSSTQSRWSDRNQPAPSQGQDNKQGGWNQRGPEHQAGNQYGAGGQIGAAPQSNQYGASRGHSFGGSKTDSFNKPPVKAEPMELGRPAPAGNQYPPNNARNYPPVKPEPRDHVSPVQSNKSFGSTMIDYNTPETKQYGVPQDHSTSYTNKDQYSSQSTGGNSSSSQQRPSRFDQGSGGGSQQYGSFNNNKNQPAGGFSQSTGYNSQQSTSLNQQSRGDTGSWNQGGTGSSYNQSGQGSGGPSQAQSGSYDLSKLGNRFGPPGQTPQGPVGASVGYDKGGNSGSTNKQSGRSSDFGASNQYNQAQQPSNYGSGQYNSQSSFGQGDQKSGYGGGNQRQSYGESQRQGYGDNARKGFGDSQNTSSGINPRQSYEDTQKQKYGDNQKSSGFGDTQRQGSGDNQRQNYGDYQKQGYGENPSLSQGYGDNSRPSYGDNSKQIYGDTSKQSYGENSRQSYGDTSSQNYGDTSRQSLGNSQRQSFGDGQKSGYGDTQRQNYGENYGQSYGDSQRDSYTKSGSHDKKDDATARSGSYGEQPAYQSYNTGTSSASQYANPVPTDLKESVSQIFQNYGSQLSAVGARASSQESEQGIQRYTSQQSYGAQQSYGTQQYTATAAVQQYTAPPDTSQGQRGGPADQAGYQQYPSQIPYQSYPGYQ